MNVKFTRKSLMMMIMLSLMVSLSLTTSVSKASNLRPSQAATIKIGSLGPLSIPVGVDMENAAELAVNEINADGGVTVGEDSYDFELISRTTSGSDGLPDTTVAQGNLQELIDTDGVNAILGGFRTEVVLAGIQPIVNSSQIPFLGVGSTAPIITEYFYRVGPVNGTTLARNLIGLYGTYLGPLLNLSNIAIVRENAAWTEAIAGAAISTLNAAPFSLNVSTETIPINQDASGSSIASSLSDLANDPSLDAIMTLFSAPVGEVVTEQWAATGLNDNVYLAGINVASQDSEFYTNTDGAAAGEIELESAPPGVNPTTKTQAFKDAYIAEHNEEPTYTSFAAYDAVYIIKEAIENAGGFTPAEIHNELPNTDYLGVATRYKFTTESTAGQVASPAVPEPFKVYNNSIAHDLYTPSTVGVPGFPYSQPYFAQWYENGTKGTIWAGSSSGWDSSIAPPYGTSDDSDNNQSSDEGLFPFMEWVVLPIAVIAAVMIRKKDHQKK